MTVAIALLVAGVTALAVTALVMIALFAALTGSPSVWLLALPVATAIAAIIWALYVDVDEP